MAGGPDHPGGRGVGAVVRVRAVPGGQRPDRAAADLRAVCTGPATTPGCSGPATSGDLYFKSHPKQTDRDYLLAVFDDLAKLPGTKDVFGPHNPVATTATGSPATRPRSSSSSSRRSTPTAPARSSTTSPTPSWDTRFLGDLYQDLSEAARKKYALLQTPISSRSSSSTARWSRPSTSSGSDGAFKMIDPACGSGHFLLGGFARILDALAKARSRGPTTANWSTARWPPSTAWT